MMMKRIVALLLMIVLLSAVLTISVPADYACYYTTDIEVTYKYDVARTMLDMINDLRAKAGVNPLTYDYTLEAIAMQRAAEISISYSHTRPDGTRWFTLKIGDIGSYAENLLYGYATAWDTMNGWIDSNSHYSTMIGEGYTAVGVGCVYCDGTYYWVQEFGYTNSGASSSASGDVTETASVKAAEAEHSYTTETVAPTCTEDGYTVSTCSVCGSQYIVSTAAALGHDYMQTVIEPTETTQGYTLYTCTRCGDSFAGDFVYALGSNTRSDIDGDGFLTVSNARMLFQYVNGMWNGTDLTAEVFDMDGDGVICAKDVRTLFQAVNRQNVS